MNSPITSPWPAVLTSSPTITFTPGLLRLRAGLQSAGDLVVVGHRDRPQPCVARGRQQHLHGRGAVVGVVGVHVQVDLDQRSLASRRSSAGSPRRGCRRAARLAIDLSSARPRRRRRGPGGSRPGSGGPSARPWRGGSPCGRPDARRSSPRSDGPRAWRAARSAGGVEGADVERARVAQGGVGGAGRERLVHVDEVELDGGEQFLDRAGDVDRQRRRAPARAAGDVEHLSDGDHPRRASVGSLEQALAGPPAAARSSLREARTRSCERDGASTSTRCPRRESSEATRRRGR